MSVTSDIRSVLIVVVVVEFLMFIYFLLIGWNKLSINIPMRLILMVINAEQQKLDKNPKFDDNFDIQTGT